MTTASSQAHGMRTTAVNGAVEKTPLGMVNASSGGTPLSFPSSRGLNKTKKK